ncbi:MAG: hypothetical protein KF734_17305 [Saprospiraceae bacterium]|nr:hypothetical protein [Saprospiraceae bacterium]
MNGLTQPLVACRHLLAAFFTFLAALPLLQAQYTPCATPPPTEAEVAAFEAEMNSTANASSGSLTWEIPVRVTVFRKSDGSGWGITYDDAFIDAFLSNMNAKMAGGPNIFHFFRCGPINYIDVDQLYNGSLPPEAFSYNRNYLNLYIYNKPGQPASATFPWHPEPKAVWMPSGIAGTSDATGFHELGHTLGLLHTFSPEMTYSVPVVPSQQDHPEQQGGRELMIRDTVPGKQFPVPNHTFAGDRVSDTPPGCDSDPQRAAFYPSSATIAGCLDGDPNTPCINGCNDGDPNTPCVNGCSWDYANCTYTGDYRDYNFDLIVDTLNVLARNIMSYTGSCRQNFTPGQVGRADLIANFFLNDYYQEQLCGNLIDRVEIEGTSTGLDRVRLRISPTADPADYTQTIVSASDDFSGKLSLSTFSVQVRADVKRFRTSDVTKLDDNWLSGLTTFDLVCIQKHILGQDTLDGYKLLAADANKSNSVTTFDIVLFRRLILGLDTTLSAYEQPWRFIPEVVTQNVIGGGLQPDFDGVGYDNPFLTVPPAMGGPAVPPTQYCEPTWPFLMRSGTVRNGFDAVKLGNICGPVAPDELAEDCPGDVALLVPNVSVAQGDIIELNVKGYGFQSVAAFQTGIRAPKDDFEFISKANGTIGDFATTENAPGDLNQVEEGIKAVWMRDNLAPQTLADGGSLFKVTLRAKENITDLSQALTFDKSILETYFLTAEGGCVSNASLEISVNNLGGGERGNGQSADNRPTTGQKIFCLPNPASDRLTVLFDAERDFDGNLLVHDMQGRLLQTVAQSFVKGRNVISLSDFARLPVGVLNISVFDGESVHAVRVSKQ